MLLDDATLAKESADLLSHLIRNECVNDGTPESGQLHMVAGSHRTTTPDPVVTDISAWPMVALETAAGDFVDPRAWADDADWPPHKAGAPGNPGHTGRRMSGN